MIENSPQIHAREEKATTTTTTTTQGHVTSGRTNSRTKQNATHAYFEIRLVGFILEFIWQKRVFVDRVFRVNRIVSPIFRKDQTGGDSQRKKKKKKKKKKGQ